MIAVCVVVVIFFFNDTATTEIYTLSLHDALPICDPCEDRHVEHRDRQDRGERPGAEERADHDRGEHRREGEDHVAGDRKSTRLNSSHANISYAVFCLKKKKNTQQRLENSSCRHMR